MQTEQRDSIQRVSTGGVWEREVGFCRVLRCGDLVFTAGTVAADEHGNIQGADAYEQCLYVFSKLDAALQQAGSGLRDVVKVVCYIASMDAAEGFTRAHREALGAINPVCTCVQVAGLFGGALVEIELTAFAPNAGAQI